MAKSTPPNVPWQYWDACLFSAYINGEPHRADLVESLLRCCDRGWIQIITSHVSIAEVAFAASERQSMTLDDGVFEKIDRLWEPPSKIIAVEVHEAISRDARKLVRHAITQPSTPNSKDSRRLKGMDAIHLASAVIAQCEVFYTYDTGLYWLSESPILYGMKVCAPVEFKEDPSTSLFKEGS